MLVIKNIEQKRLELQKQLDLSKTKAERNRLGQFATPSSLATDILNYSKSLLTPGIKINFLDPAMGTGAFVAALYDSFPEEQISKAVGYEIDPLYANAASNLWKSTSLQINVADFTKAEPLDNDKFNLLICNPPYVRHHHLSKEDKQRLLQATKNASKVRVSERSGLYCHFLWISHKWLAEDGLAAWLIPSEFMSVNYGEQVRDYLLNQVALLRVHCFTPADVQFKDALVTSSIIWFKKSSPSRHQKVDFSYGGTLTNPKTIDAIPLTTLQQAKKWNALSIALNASDLLNKNQEPQSHTNIANSDAPVEIKQKVYKLADFFEIKRGLATGSNGFFVLNRQQILEYQIPEEFLKPILPSSRYLINDEIKADSNGNPILKEPLFLLTCNLPENDIKAKYPSLWKYLQWGIERGIDKLYLCSHRTPWYSQEKRSAPLFVYSYMGRQKSEGSSPFRFILNHSKALATNSYYVLYPKKDLQEAINKDTRVLIKFWENLKNLSPENLLIEGRTYGGGLHKMEPNELANVLIKNLPEILLQTTEVRQDLWQTSTAQL
ncbi:MAG TPA: N-6 DNA methylase [Ktedonobacteraceae bacterium]|jgi:predicted RNA methylase